MNLLTVLAESPAWTSDASEVLEWARQYLSPADSVVPGGAWIGLASVGLGVGSLAVRAACKRVSRSKDILASDYPSWGGCALATCWMLFTAVLGLELSLRLPGWASSTGSQFIEFEAFAAGGLALCLAVHLANVVGMVFVFRRNRVYCSSVALASYSIFLLLGMLTVTIGLNLVQLVRPDWMPQLLQFWPS